MRRFLLLICVLLVLMVFSWVKSLNNERIIIKVGETAVRVDVADTDSERRQGLSGREELEDGNGLLFVFDRAGVYGFWMKDMNFAIDVIWIGEDKKVVGIEKGVEPSTYPTIFYPPSEVLYVLEVPATFSDATNINVGQSLLIGE